MVGRVWFAGAALITSALAIPAVSQVNTASVNTTDNTPSTSAEATLATPTTSVLGELESLYNTSAWLPHGQALVPQLPQWATNGNSVLGTANAPQLPQWLNGPLPNGFPWGSRTSSNTNYYLNPPETGVTRHYDFTVSKQMIAPDGVEVEGIVVNGAFPGPTIEANWGDWIEVIVHNALPDEGTSLHWHGLLQKATPYMDGVPGVQQCPIAPGSTFTYRFKADLYGTSWYHSHYSAQYASGAAGPMIIHGPNNAHYDVDLGPVMLSDWYHRYYYDNIEQVMAPSSERLPPPVSNNNLINGKMNYPCAEATGLKCTPNAGISKFHFQSGKVYRLRLINHGAEGIQKFSIDGHQLTVIANDFVEIVPYTTDVVTLAIGQRSDVLVTATGKSKDAVWMRSTLGISAFQGGCTLNDGISPEAVAAIYYQNANTSAVPQTTSSVSIAAINTCANDPLVETQPFYSITPTSRPQTVQEIDITFQNNGTNDLFYMNNSTFRVDYNDPVLLDAKLGHNNYPADYNVYNFGSSRSIQLVIYNHALLGAHPMHMHGHNMYILAVGSGSWDGTVTSPRNPQRRDVQLLPNAVSPIEPSYLVVQIDADNPGVWPFHCHIAWHVSTGLYINILERPDLIKLDMQIPSISAQTCRDWSAWTGTHVPDEIDSGL